MWVLTFNYKFHYGNQAKGLAAHLRLILISFEAIDDNNKMANDTHVR